MTTIGGGSPRLRVIPLGGVGEIGKNMYVVEKDGRCVVIDCGVSFPSHDQLGVDLVLPDFSYLVDRRDTVDAVILTHGHEDHVGALPYFLRAAGPIPVYGTRFVLGLVRSKLDEHRLLDQTELVEITPGEGRPVGPFDAEFIAITHSMPGAVVVALHSDAGTLVHTGDFWFDHTPVAGPRTDIAALARLGDRGVNVLLSDSTGAESPGRWRSERGVGRELRRVFATAPGRVIVTTFASHIHRVQQVLDAAWADGRVVALVGRSMVRNTGIARNLGELTVRDGVLVQPRDLEGYPDDEVVIVSTGSQGEPLSALSRMARGEHPQIAIRANDTVVYSSRTVPGNELAVGEVINRLARAGARFVTWESNPDIHHSGHATAGDLLWMLELLRPRVFVPIHGERRHQRAHADLAESLGIAGDDVFIMDNGDVLEVGEDSAEVVERVEAGILYVDGLGVGDVVEGVLRDRRRLADEGLMLVVATVSASDGTLVGTPDVIARGFPAGEDPELVEEITLEVERSLAASASEHVTEIGLLQHQLHDAVAALLNRRTKQRPMVLPVIVEV
ncbi:MAG: ribonuclease J [Actinomycetota bacterium]